MPTLSIYIPSFEKKKTLHRLLDSLLKCTDERFEIIILDDFSQDGTWESLFEVSDDRVKKYRNDRNLGAVSTWGRAISLCSGKWIFHLNDRDEINVHNISNFINFLDKIGDEYGVVFPQCEKKNRYFKPGQQAFYRFAYCICHPTGVVLKRDMINSIVNWQNYYSYENYGMYPQGYLFAEAMNECGCILSVHFIWRETLSTHKTCKNFWSGSSGKIESVNNRLYNDIECVKYNLKRNVIHIYSHSAWKRKWRILFVTYYKNLKFTTFGYSKDISDPDRARHYGLRRHKPTIRENFSRMIEMSMYTFGLLKGLHICDLLLILFADFLWIIVYASGNEKWQ